MRQEQAAHIDEVVRVAVGERTARDAVIQESWRRCVDEHKLDPVVLRDAQILPQAQLREHRDAMDEFLHTARVGLETLYRQVCGLGYVLLLTDAKGVTVDFIGDPTFNDQLHRAGLYLGADWAETHMGTCAVGTCIATGEALTVHQSDHFDATHIPLTCTAAPIFDSGGTLAGVLDISALKSPEPKQSQYLALQLVKSYAHKIENANLLNNFRSEWILKLAASQEFADVDPDCVLAIDAGGRIIGFNDRARRLLLREAALRSMRNPNPLGAMISDYLDCRIDDLPLFAHSLPTRQRAVRLLASGTTLFAQSLPPPARASQQPAPARKAALARPLETLHGGDPMMEEVVARAARLVNTQMSILIHGETGTGKEHLAKAIHAASARAGKPFVAVNCAALPETLIESELFGHEPGAFTGAAAKGKKGLVIEADGGTLFLDEIGDMPLALQTRLLRVLAEREVTPVGRTRPVPVNIRVIAATHRDLVELVRAGEFREDLYFRLNSAVLALPALRQRADLVWLIGHLMATHGDGALPRRLSPAAMNALKAYSWPGNIRELVNCLDYARAVATSDVIDVADLPPTIFEEALLHSPVPSPARAAVPEETARAERLVEALRARQWNVSAVAREWGLDRSTIHRRMRRFGIVPPHKLS
ncbi:Transcriptional regulator of acetoin/glycerol metabolism [Chelatococcus sambhunathii]|uniref:Transcriptional regulator of acetoin/glycerol metabolism n=1 Tax=Chelatococcus sambhunathii TaxID=363953 RepID=A0ABM9U3E7_9HYPH|nr:sigma-54-dependent Fis family transcriptional regulator [Chelatococcus sambhunathii]CUA87481.1 Transcriptional regulator of acetoin/glycerol metabolism [Chelatococcus sambhunathii]